MSERSERSQSRSLHHSSYDDGHAAPGVITAALSRWADGDEEGRARAYALAYPKLLCAASRFMAGERCDHTLDPRSLVSEVYLRLQHAAPQGWSDRRHFMRTASMVMRRILVDHARARNCQRRRGDGTSAAASGMLVQAEQRDERLVALDDALEQLREHSLDHATLVTLSYFGGMSQIELADFFECSLATIERRLAFARAWLQRAMTELPIAAVSPSVAREEAK
jgi:RNA polymerase sigma factor (TIGR02999 family)